MEPLVEQGWLNLVKDASIGVIALLVLGRILFLLGNVATTFLGEIREDNKARNEQFNLLLQINQAVAGQIELTRLAIERHGESTTQQEALLRASIQDLTGLCEELRQVWTELTEQLPALLTKDRTTPPAIYEAGQGSNP
jgi:hypothetical protein